MEQGFAVVLVAGLAVFGLMFIASESDFTSPDAPKEEKVVFAEKSVGSVGGAKTDMRNISFRSFTVGETRGYVQAYTEEKVKISNSLFSGNTIKIKYNATQPQKGQISFEVLGRTGTGKIWATVNGKNVFKAATVSGATPTINFSGSKLNPGINHIKIGTTQGGLLDSASYTLEDVEVAVNDRKFHDFHSSFELYSHELNNYVGSNLTFTIPVDSSRPQAPLEISINGHKIFSQELVRSTQEISISKRKADLTPGYNTIDFETDGEAKYEINNPEIVMRYIGRTAPGTVRLDFEMTAGQLAYAKKDSTEEYISFNYQNLLPSDHPLKISLNGEKYSSTPLNGENKVDIEAKALQQENTLLIRSNGSFNMQNLQILSKRIENR
ncbi:MAG: hypothetical protein ABEK04_02975 [Candidatus Nanohalobium sp.]